MEEVVVKRNPCHNACLKYKLDEDNHNLDVAKKEIDSAVPVAQETKLQEFTADLQS